MRGRDVGIQEKSLQVDTGRGRVLHSLLVVDDVTTSKATLQAVITLLRSEHPGVAITAFAFGKTQQTGSTAFPEQPVFPEPQGTTVEDLAGWLIENDEQ